MRTLFRIAAPIMIILTMSLYTWKYLTWFSHDILSAALPAGCALLFCAKETQPVFTIAADCSGKDLVQLWPLSV